MENNSNINIIDKKNRLDKAVAYLKGEQIIKTQKDISKKMGMSEETISRALKGLEKYLTDSFLEKFAYEFKDFQWGDAELSDEYRDRLYYFIEEVREYFVDNAIGEAKGKPTGYYYPEVSASAGFDIATFNNEAMRIPIYLPEFGKDVIFINVYGDSMYPKYKSGDMIGVKPTDFQYVVFGHPYVVVFDNGDVNIKYVCKGSDNEHVKLVSENLRYEPREYSLRIIKEFHSVIGCVNRERM